jgi:transposase-like protein
MLDPDDVFQTPITSAEATELALSPAQFVAIDLMLQGSTMVAAARSAGVTRKTLYRWLHHDPKFQAAYNAWQLDALTSARSRLLAMTDDAVNTLAARVKTDGRLAFSLLKSLGTLDRPTPGSTDPEEIEVQRQLEAQRAQEKLGQELFFASLGSFSGKPTASQLIAGLKKTPGESEAD